MRQEEFLNSFREALIGKVPDNVIQDNLNYYRNYISSQINSGRREEDVLGSLGDPRLLAKTIEESNKFAMGEEGKAIIRTIMPVRTGTRMMVRNRRLVIIRRLICPGGC